MFALSVWCFASLVGTYSVIEHKGLFTHSVLSGSLRSSGDCSLTVCWVASLVSTWRRESAKDCMVSVCVLSLSPICHRSLAMHLPLHLQPNRPTRKTSTPPQIYVNCLANPLSNLEERIVLALVPQRGVCDGSTYLIQSNRSRGIVEHIRESIDGVRGWPQEFPSSMFAM